MAAEEEQNGRVAVIGAGAIGGFLAGELDLAGRAVTLCVRTPIDRLTIESKGQTRTVPVEIAADPSTVGPASWVLVATKAQDTAEAAGWLGALCGAGTRVVVVQNGVGHEARARPFVGEATIVPAIIYSGNEKVRPGHIVHHGGARLVVPAGPDGEAVAALFAGATIEIVRDPDLTTAAWRKLLSNLVANPITALTLRRMTVLRDPAIAALGRDLLLEALPVARAEGARIEQPDIDKIIDGYAAWTGRSGSSMFYDRLAGRPLEHVYITGAVVEAGDRHGIAVPLNRAVLALLAASSGHAPDAEA